MTNSNNLNINKIYNDLINSNNIEYKDIEGFLYNFVDYIKYNKFSDLDDLKEFLNGEQTFHDNIYDIINELSDTYVDIYNEDLIEWSRHNYNYINEAAEEYGQAEDFIKSIMQGQYYYNNEKFIEAVEIFKDFVDDMIDEEEE